MVNYRQSNICKFDRGAVHHQYPLPGGFRKAVAAGKGMAAEETERRTLFLAVQNKICPAVASAEGYHQSSITGQYRLLLMADALHRSFFDRVFTENPSRKRVFL